MALSRKENGCERYDAFLKENGIIIVERWANQAVLDLHKTQQHFSDLVSFIEIHSLDLTITSVSSLL